MKKKVKNFAEACQVLNIKQSLPDVSSLPEKHQKAILAHYQLVIIAEALNDGWKPNWNDLYEYKYYPWFDVEADDKNPSGLGLSSDGCGATASTTHVGSRLCFKSRELAEYAGEKFQELYTDYFLLK
jgi:hypothetical protein